jgi:hypothetical protein
MLEHRRAIDRPADVLLGPDHPLPRAARTLASVRRQLRVCTAFLLALALAFRSEPARGAWLIGSAAAVALTLAGLVAWLKDECRRRARDVIIQHGAGLAVPEVEAEAGRLAEIKHRRRLATQLEAALEAAERWWQISPASRPPPTVRNMLPYREAALSAIALLRGEYGSPRGVAIVERLLDGGYGSALYTGDARGVGEELRRAVFELSRTPSDGRTWPAHHASGEGGIRTRE